MEYLLDTAGGRDPVAAAWLLLQLGKADPEFRRDPGARQLRELLVARVDERGMARLLQQIATVFDGTESATGDDVTSIGAAKNAPVKPGCREHNNDKENYRDISIMPTPSELQSTEIPFLPLPSGSIYLDDATARVRIPSAGSAASPAVRSRTYPPLLLPSLSPSPHPFRLLGRSVEACSQQDL